MCVCSQNVQCSIDPLDGWEWNAFLSEDLSSGLYHFLIVCAADSFLASKPAHLMFSNGRRDIPEVRGIDGRLCPWHERSCEAVDANEVRPKDHC